MNSLIGFSLGNNLPDIFLIHAKLVPTGHTDEYINYHFLLYGSFIEMLQMFPGFYSISALSAISGQHIPDVLRIFVNTGKYDFLHGNSGALTNPKLPWGANFK